MSKPAAQRKSGLRRQIAQGLQLLQQGRLQAAAQLAERILQSFGDDAAALNFASEVRTVSGDTTGALDLIERAIATAPENLQLQLRKARLLLMLRRRAEARATLEMLAERVGDDAQALWAIGRQYHQANDPARAVGYLERARTRLGTPPQLLYDLASSQFFTGDFAAAEDTLDSMLAEAPASGAAHYLRATLRQQTAERNHLASLRDAIAHVITKPVDRAACLYALGKELEDLGEYQQSITALLEGAELMRSTLKYDPGAELANIGAISQTFTTDALAAASTGHGEPGAIFIVGMPRSGTTLVESILARHPGVGAAGELSDVGLVLAAASRELVIASPGLTQMQAATRVDFQAVGAEYMRGAREAAPGSPIFIDKLPVNYLYCGAIHRALPQARIIHLVRDPMDSCYAMLKTFFAQAYFFSYDLREIADYYAAYRALMRHWHGLLPGVILDVNYEDLVARPESEARRIVEWCGLDWRPGLLQSSAADTPVATASAAQVRQPIHTRSVHKWKHYAAWLAPLQARLTEKGVIAAG